MDETRRTGCPVRGNSSARKADLLIHECGDGTTITLRTYLYQATGMVQYLVGGMRDGGLMRNPTYFYGDGQHVVGGVRMDGADAARLLAVREWADRVTAELVRRADRDGDAAVTAAVMEGIDHG